MTLGILINLRHENIWISPFSLLFSPLPSLSSLPNTQTSTVWLYFNIIIVSCGCRKILSPVHFPIPSNGYALHMFYFNIYFLLHGCFFSLEVFRFFIHFVSCFFLQLKFFFKRQRNLNWFSGISIFKRGEKNYPSRKYKFEFPDFRSKFEFYTAIRQFSSFFFRRKK